jgi:hypothetical protein
VKGLARAILETLTEPLDSATLKLAAEPYTVEASTDRYLDALGLRKGNRESIMV